MTRCPFTQPHGSRDLGVGITLVLLGGVHSCFIVPTDAMTGNNCLSLSCVQKEHFSRVSSSLASLGGELEVDRSEPDA